LEDEAPAASMSFPPRLAHNFTLVCMICTTILSITFLILAKTLRSPRTARTRKSNPKPVLEQQIAWRLHLRREKRSTLVLEHQKGKNEAPSRDLNFFLPIHPIFVNY
jgi:hypothetical protein